MKIEIKSAVIAFILLFLTGCEITPKSPITNETRNVTPIENPDSAIVVRSDMKFYDGKPITKILRFPKGIYTLESEDEDYFYYKFENRIEINQLKAFKGIFEPYKLRGGIMICKQIFFEEDGYFYYLPPAVAYVEGETDDTRVAIWMLDKEFLGQRGFAWDKTKLTPNQPKTASP